MDGKVWQCKQGEHMGSWGNYCGDLLIFLTFNDTSFWWEWEVFREEACHMKIKKKKFEVNIKYCEPPSPCKSIPYGSLLNW